MPNLSEYNILVYFSCITLIISSLLYIQFYNKTILGGIKDELRQYEIDDVNFNEILNEFKKEKEPINKFKYLIVTMLLIISLFFLFELTNIRSHKSKILRYGAPFVLILIPFIIILGIFSKFLDVGDEDETEKDKAFKLNDNKEGINNGGSLIIVFILFYYLFRLFFITKGFLGKESRITYYNNFIFYEKIFGLLFIVLLCSSVIIVNNKKKELMNNLNGKNVGNITFKENNKNNNTIINVLVGILITFLGIYYFNNHIKNNKFDLIGSFQNKNILNVLKNLFDLPLFLLIGAFATVGLIQY